MNRKPLLGLFFVCFAFLHLFAEHGTDSALQKEVPMNVYEGLNEDELKVDLWDLSGRVLLQENSGKIQVSDGVLVEQLWNRSDYFLLRNDTLLWTGYNYGRRLGYIISQPMPLIESRLSINIEDSPYKASGKLDVKTAILAEGINRMETLGSGSVIISPGDTIAGVKLIRQVDYSISKIEATNESDTLLRTVCRWYLSNSIVPFAIQDGKRLYIAQSDFFDKVKEDFLHQETDRTQDIIDSAELNFDGKSINVHLSEALQLNVYVMDVQGNIYRSAEGKDVDYSIDVSGLPHANYVISLVSTTGYMRKIFMIL